MSGTQQSGEQDKSDQQRQGTAGAPNQGVSTTEPAEGADDSPGRQEGSPEG